MRDATPQARVRLVLSVGVLCCSFPAILVRYAAAEPVAIAFWRKALAALVLVPLAWRSHRRGEWTVASLRPVLGPCVAAGLLLAGHFACWMTSVKTTTVASSLVLGSTGPVWAALLGALFLGDRVTRRGGAAIALSLVGVAALAGGDWRAAGPALSGDLLAVAAALFASAYLTVGRAVRARLPLAPWLLGVYGTAAAALGAYAAVAEIPLTGFDGRTWWMFALLALVPSTLGHNLLNYAVRHMEAYKVGLAILAEPVVSTALAALLFGEVPGGRFYAGASLTLSGVLLALWPAARPAAAVLDAREEEPPGGC